MSVAPTSAAFTAGAMFSRGKYGNVEGAQGGGAVRGQGPVPTAFYLEGCHLLGLVSDPLRPNGQRRDQRPYAPHQCLAGRNFGVARVALLQQAIWHKCCVSMSCSRCAHCPSTSEPVAAQGIHQHAGRAAVPTVGAYFFVEKLDADSPRHGRVLPDCPWVHFEGLNHVDLASSKGGA